MIVRQQYMNVLKTYRDVQLVKILVGILHAGKTTILMMLYDDLLNSGIPEDHIIYMCYTSKYLDHKAMYESIKEKIKDNERYYLLLDEVQEIEGWERAVNSLLENYNTDIYVAGSNSKLLPNEISTYSTGRYISIPVYTLSFEEYLEFKKDDSKSIKEQINDYIRMGGFPIVANNNFDEHLHIRLLKVFMIL